MQALSEFKFSFSSPHQHKIHAIAIRLITIEFTPLLFYSVDLLVTLLLAKVAETDGCKQEEAHLHNEETA